MAAGGLILWPFRYLWLRVLLLALLATSLPWPLLAHPLGNFSTNRYSHLNIDTHQVDVFYVVDLAEIPTHRIRLEMDDNGDNMMSADERSHYAAALATQIASELELTVDGNRLPLVLQQQTVAFQSGQAGLETLRLEFMFAAALPDGSGERSLRYTDRVFDEQIGWQEVIVTGAEGVKLLASDAPATDLSDALRAYPADLLATPLASSRTQVTFVAQAEGSWLRAMVPGVMPLPAQLDSGKERSAGSATDPFAELIAIPELGAWAIFLALFAAFGWGAVHAMSPGHGKTIVGAYLVGSRGTVQHAIFLGLTTTITHTVGVFVLGLIALAASHFLRPEQLYPWLGTCSGLIVATIGVERLRSWWRHHDHHHIGVHHAHDHDHHHTHGHAHDHAHDHQLHRPSLYTHDHGDGQVHNHLPPGADGTPVSWRSLLALGVSGGLLPCPSALVVMLGAIALGRVAFGLVLITVFSLGLASVLTAIGIALVHAGKLFERIPEHVHVTRWLPVASALFITGAGLVVAIQALASTGLFVL